MTEQEYIEIMDNSNFLIDSANPYDMEIKKALEKQIPKKPIIKTNLMTKHVSAHCSICDTDITYYLSEENYCHNCGQAIKWESEE